MIVVVSGIRDLALASHGAVRDAIESVTFQSAFATARSAFSPSEAVTELRFGGAIGVDTVALRAAHALPVRKVVYVPFTLAQQPKEAREAIAACADAVVALRLGDPATNKGAYLERNVAMLTGQGHAAADLLLAFTDGRTTGGTAYTIRQARKLVIDIETVTVVSERGLARERKRHGFRR